MWLEEVNSFIHSYPYDKGRARQVLKVWRILSEREAWSRIPHYGLGGSSGGAFVLFLAQRLPLDGVCVEVYLQAQLIS